MLNFKSTLKVIDLQSNKRSTNFLYSQTLFNTDILPNFSIEEINPEKQEAAKEMFIQKLKRATNVYIVDKN